MILHQVTRKKNKNKTIMETSEVLMAVAFLDKKKSRHRQHGLSVLQKELEVSQF